ncbi:MAG TPA: DUF427 domain-containing protein [Acidimicrobiia bacterium]|nr:DUF427 domain-containing protein [Acidimicrobiia bacterium]
MNLFATRRKPVAPGPGQESVWDYPRPPRVEPVTGRLAVVLGGETVAATSRGLRVLETSHPPNYYFPLADVAPGVLERSSGGSFCEFKGRAHYYAVRGGGRVEPDAAWVYDEPGTGYESLAGTVAFYAGRTDACFVDGERVTAQPGGFYGGWITSTVTGPFKGGPGTEGW